ncbi:TIM-barrel domain-containing protein [Actinospica robiniae]|uniref:glycoside hydrolase family 31 protein n=1 Tax=Actinospica robiniae TaxID=304901 RepID=UPI001B7FC9EF|nr:TIM-barrel domain-containing protein [Actinospica robiniae]
MEWSDREEFVDLPTQLAVNRRFPVPEFTVTDEGGTLNLWTRSLHLSYNRERFTPEGLSISLRTKPPTALVTTWRFGETLPCHPTALDNLGGTVSALDDADGPVPLSSGVLSANGLAVISDPRAMLFTADDWFTPGPETGEDLYFFGYGRDFRSALRDYFHLTGPSPLLPRYALGNWWSRYHRYRDEEYLQLMDRFAAEGIPLSVAVLDMDWHLVDLDPELGAGWTGYTWNPELFPDAPAFLRELHERGLAVSLNLHPGDGVRRHEAAYPQLARALGQDPATGREVAFDPASRDFAEHYLSLLHHPLEEQGVDFWWVDWHWQAGGATRARGVDPLWLLNHLHYTDSGRCGRRPLTLSRNAGPGGHRYPVGFSGDTIATWASLAFQPYFTATAANLGFFWWSNDVGGHMLGARDDELAVRWYQFGAFSPINRLHSSRSRFDSREPWLRGTEAAGIMADFLRLRHLMVPYMYSAMWTAHTDGLGVVRPMYHDYPDQPEAYCVTNQYMFGPDLLVAPVTAPADAVSHLATVSVWLPEGIWFDFFTGRRYTGGRRLVLHRRLAQMPVFARAGAVIPLAADPMASADANPAAIVLRAFPGSSGSAVLYEDDGSAYPTTAERHETPVTTHWSDVGDDTAELHLAIGPVKGQGSLTKRIVLLDLIGVQTAPVAAALSRPAAGEERPVSGSDRVGVGPLPSGVIVDLGCLDLSVAVAQVSRLRPLSRTTAEDVFDILQEAAIDYEVKEHAYAAAERYAAGRLSGTALAGLWHSLALPGNLYGALLEIISAADDY